MQHLFLGLRHNIDYTTLLPWQGSLLPVSRVGENPGNKVVDYNRFQFLNTEFSRCDGLINYYKSQTST